MRAAIRDFRDAASTRLDRSETCVQCLPFLRELSLMYINDDLDKYQVWTVATLERDET